MRVSTPCTGGAGACSTRCRMRSRRSAHSAGRCGEGAGGAPAPALTPERPRHERLQAALEAGIELRVLALDEAAAAGERGIIDEGPGVPPGGPGRLRAHHRG